MSRLICFIDKEGFVGTCSEEAIGKLVVSCKKCSFKKKFEGTERKRVLLLLLERRNPKKKK